MINTIRAILLLSVLLLIMPVRQLSAADVEPVSDVRIIIDVSGSMKKNDPKNLRSPALRLVVGLLPEGAKSGVWTFGKYVNMLVPYRDVNDAWKLEAEMQSDKIHSYGLFTNIEQALKKATANQKGDDSRFRRSVILLSDGLVDVSMSEETNKQSRQRIIENILPRLKKANVSVHTVALSDTADHELLRAISLATDGWYEQVDTAEQLQRVFLHLFEKAAKRDSVPLLDNNFKIDDSVSEMTLLVFRREGAKQTELILPNQSRVSNQDKPNNVRWHNEDNYDLITIDSPLSGAWQIDADVDPDNRVMVVTDLQLRSTDLPNNILIGETFDFDASLTEKGELIVRQDFLKLVDAQLLEESEIADPIEKDLNEEQKKGIYQAHVGETFQPGRNDIVISFTSPTFERQRRQSINVVDTPFIIDVEQLKDEVSRTHRLTLQPDLDLIKAEPLNIAVMLTANDGSEWSYEVLKNSEGNWQLTLADLEPNEEYTMALQIRGETVKGRSLFLQPEVIVLQDDTIIESSEEIIEQQAENTLVDEVEEEIIEPIIDEMAGDLDDLLPEIEADVLIDNSTVETTDDSASISPAMKLAIGNGIILVLAAMGILLWRRKRAESQNIGGLL